MCIGGGSFMQYIVYIWLISGDVYYALPSVHVIGTSLNYIVFGRPPIYMLWLYLCLVDGRGWFLFSLSLQISSNTS